MPPLMGRHFICLPACVLHDKITYIKHIPLISGGYTVVSDEDFEYLNQWKWRIDNKGYAQRTSRLPNGLSRLMHRIVCNTPDGAFTDHINHDKLDNRRENLRVCTTSQNGWNSRPSSLNPNGLKGVSYSKKHGKWRAYISEDGKQVWLGWFYELQDAIRAYNIAALQKRGDFALLNQLDDSRIDSLQSEAEAYRREIERQMLVTSSNRSGYRGVSWSKRDLKWRVYIGLNGQHFYIDQFSEAEEAAYVYHQVAIQLHGERALLNLL